MRKRIMRRKKKANKRIENDDIVLEKKLSQEEIKEIMKLSEKSLKDF